ncbi:hypothetical protein JY651_29555 [Pyxidicoccus parkwayensis]|uniref:Uncharacterized protein n=1 Tax=Pyxidicoccus parkwayensis TaxID=2813578 RepID=A0ABX7NKS3_9BACT|nr:hypothetical protein [Pyxidicoccus parkwaysis]QSQ19455.1 hypothetical protein JY651_29555 [Pyxidicoccus parkwaysis]
MGAGAPHSDWYFEPFTRGYFEADYQPPERRPRAVTGGLRGHVRGPNASALPIHLTMELEEPWRLWRMMETWMVSHGQEDVWFSLNQRGEDTLELGGRTHAEPAEVARLMEDFFQRGPAELDLGYEVEFRNLEGAVLQTWRSPSR